MLHGDLHHDNVLTADREPWLAIDPHGVLGDPEKRAAYELDLDYVKDVLRVGNRRANELAKATLDEVREAMGMVY